MGVSVVIALIINNLGPPPAYAHLLKSSPALPNYTLPGPTLFAPATLTCDSSHTWHPSCFPASPGAVSFTWNILPTSFAYQTLHHPPKLRHQS